MSIVTRLVIAALALALPATAALAGAPHYATPQEPRAPGQVTAPSAPQAPSDPRRPSDPSQPSEVEQPSEPAQPNQPDAPTHGTVSDPGAPSAPGAPGHATVSAPGTPGHATVTAPGKPGSPGKPGAPQSPAMVQALNMVRAVAAGGIQERQQVLGPQAPAPTGLAPFAMGDMGLAQAPMAGKLADDLTGVGHRPLLGPNGEMIIASCGHPGQSRTVQVDPSGFAAGKAPTQPARPAMAPHVKTLLLEEARLGQCTAGISPLPGLPWLVAGPIWAWEVEAAAADGPGLASALGADLGAAIGMETERRVKPADPKASSPAQPAQPAQPAKEDRS